MLIVAEHVVLPEHEPDLGEIRQPCKQRVPAADVPGTLMITRNVPDHVFIGEGWIAQRSLARNASAAFR